MCIRVYMCVYRTISNRRVRGSLFSGIDRSIHESNGTTQRFASSLLFSFFFIFLLRPIERTDPIRRAQHESSRSCFVACSVAMQIGGKLTTTNDQLTFRRLHPQLFHAFPDLFEVRVRDPHAIGHEFVARRIGQRAVTPGHHGSAAFLASGHLNCSQDNTHG